MNNRSELLTTSNGLSKLSMVSVEQMLHLNQNLMNFFLLEAFDFLVSLTKIVLNNQFLFSYCYTVDFFRNIKQQ